MKKITDTDRAMQRLAKNIANDLSTSGGGEKATSLQLYSGERYLGGWTRGSLTDRILIHLKAAAIRQRRKARCGSDGQTSRDG